MSGRLNTVASTLGVIRFSEKVVVVVVKTLKEREKKKDITKHSIADTQSLLVSNC